MDRYKSVTPRIIRALNKIDLGEIGDGRHILEEMKNEIEVPSETLYAVPDKCLNDLFVFRAYIQFLISYATLWQRIIAGKYGNSWQSLQDALDQLRIVKKFSCKNDESRPLSFFENQLISLEKLYPYNIFFSVGAVVDYYECSICGLDIDSEECPHFKGELYNGVMAVAIAKNIREFNHVSMVKHPQDKRCVVQYDDNGEQFKLVRFLSTLLRERKLKPFDFGELRFSEKTVPNPDYVKLRRNEKCFCGSGLKFKRCCVDKKTVTGGHVDIVGNPTSAQAIVA